MINKHKSIECIEDKYPEDIYENAEKYLIVHCLRALVYSFSKACQMPLLTTEIRNKCILSKISHLSLIESFTLLILKTYTDLVLTDTANTW